jgi:hypothetical protein
MGKEHPDFLGYSVCNGHKAYVFLDAFDWIIALGQFLSFSIC